VFYETVTRFGITTEIHSVDLPENVQHVEHPHSKRGVLVRNRPGVFLHLGDGLEVSLGLLRSLPESCRPLFFLDGDHEYSSVRRELDGILRSIEDPKILLHDTFFQSEDSGYNIGPHLAIEAALNEHKRPLRVISTKTGLPGMTLIY
jgi:hypothetical protein